MYMRNIITKIIIIWFTFFLFLPNISFADTNLKNINYKKNIEVWKNFSIDLTSIKKNLEEKFWTKVFLEWNIKWDVTKIWDVFEKVFENIWEKKIILSIYKLDSGKKNLLITKDISIFIFSKSHTIITQKSIKHEKNRKFYKISKRIMSTYHNK